MGSEIQPITFTFFNIDGVEETWSDPIAEQITKATGVTLNVQIPIDIGNQDVGLMIAGQDYPDLIYAKGNGDALIEAGALIDLAPLIEQYGANIKKMYGDELKRLCYNTDNTAIYQLSSNAIGGERYETGGCAQLQWQVIEENQYKIPYTLEEYETMIKEYLRKYPNMEDGTARIGITLSCSDWHWYITLGNPAGYIADGSIDNGQWIVDDTTLEVKYKHTTDAEKEYFRWLNRMYHEGILDPEFATQTQDDYINKIATGRVLGLLDSDWNYNKAEVVLESQGRDRETYAGLPVTINETVACQALRKTGLAAGWGVGITKACKDPVRAIQFLDWMCSDEAQILVNWGIEGVNYEIDKNGKRSRIEVGSDENTGLGLHSFPFPTYGYGVLDSTGNSYRVENKDYVIQSYNTAENRARAAWGVELITDILPQPEQFENIKYTPIWSKSLPGTINAIEASLDELSRTGLIKCILGEEEEFDLTWERLQMQLSEAGVEKAEQLLTDLVRKEVAAYQ